MSWLPHGKHMSFSVQGFLETGMSTLWALFAATHKRGCGVLDTVLQESRRRGGHELVSQYEGQRGGLRGLHAGGLPARWRKCVGAFFAPARHTSSASSCAAIVPMSCARCSGERPLLRYMQAWRGVGV